MTDQEAIREIKKIEKIILKIVKANYDISIIEGNQMVLTSQFLANKRDDRMDTIGSESKETGLLANEIIYSFEI